MSKRVPVPEPYFEFSTATSEAGAHNYDARLSVCVCCGKDQSDWSQLDNTGARYPTESMTQARYFGCQHRLPACACWRNWFFFYVANKQLARQWCHILCPLCRYKKTREILRIYKARRSISGVGRAISVKHQIPEPANTVTDELVYLLTKVLKSVVSKTEVAPSSKMLLSQSETRKLLGVSENCLENLFRSGQLPFVRVGRLVKVRAKDLDKFCATGTGTRTADGFIRAR